MIKNIKWLLLVSLTFMACNDDETVTYDTADGLPLTAGTANFSKYVALGDSFAAGFSDGALFIEGQKGAYPNILAQQFALVGGGTFTTPFMADNTGGLLLGGTPIQGVRLYFNGKAPVAVAGSPTTEITNRLTGKFNNMGIPGAKSFHLLAPGYGNIAGVALQTASPYFSRFSSNATTTVLADAVAQTPTFFSLWIGGNDVLGYALSGGDGTNPITPSAGAAGVGFDATYEALVNTLTAATPKGVVANLPYVNSLPFFTFVATNPVPLNATQVASLNQLWGGLNAILAAAAQPARFQTLTVSATNPLLIADDMLAFDATALFTAALQGAPFNFPAPTAGFLGTLYGKARHASAAAATRDFVLLSSAGTIGTTQPGLPPNNNTIGVTFPMADKAILSAGEVALVKTATDAYNDKIKAVATAKGLAFVDAKMIMNDLSTTGITANNFTINATFVSGGAFSLDGFHPTPRGYALIANEFIKAINLKYGSNLNGVNLGNYRILFPRDAANF
jgi:lysophospholipase L1-like esterase